MNSTLISDLTKFVIGMTTSVIEEKYGRCATFFLWNFNWSHREAAWI